MMSAYSVMDNVNKYRHGVLLGNYVEDKFGTDLAQKVTILPFRVPIQMQRKYPLLNSSMTQPILYISHINLLRKSSNAIKPSTKQQSNLMSLM